MTKQVFKILSLFILALTFDRCAQVGRLTGGERDITPPKLLEATPANQSVSFSSNVITLRFDEYIQVTDIANQLIISPKITINPEVQADGKKVTITFKKEELQPNTTYRFYLGQAVVDMNEGNPIRNLEYTFSTGSFIDSLKISGRVSEAFNNKAAGNVLVALYTDKENTDSLPYLKTPDYINRTDDNGGFTFSNLPYSSFKTYAFTDKNKNNLYDGETEKIAFSDNTLKLNSDSSISFRLFREEPTKLFIKKTLAPYPGLFQILLSKKTVSNVRPLDVKQAANLYELNAGMLKDTIALYYKNVPDTLKLTLTNALSKKTDTLQLSVPKKGISKKKFKNVILNTVGANLPYKSNPKIIFPNWMDTLKTNRSKIHLKSKVDSLISLVPVKGRWLNATAFELDVTLKEGTDYSLKVDTNAFFDMNSISNDSLQLNFKTQSKTDFGKLTLKLLLNKKQDYIIQLINDKEEVITEQNISFSLSASNSVSIDMIDLQPGTYLVKIVFDDNKNKKWDTGDLILKQQPERVLIHSKQVKILSDWEIEEEISIRE